MEEKSRVYRIMASTLKGQRKGKIEDFVKDTNRTIRPVERSGAVNEALHRACVEFLQNLLDFIAAVFKNKDGVSVVAEGRLLTVMCGTEVAAMLNLTDDGAEMVQPGNILTFDCISTGTREGAKAESEHAAGGIGDGFKTAFEKCLAAGLHSAGFAFVAPGKSTAFEWKAKEMIADRNRHPTMHIKMTSVDWKKNETDYPQMTTFMRYDMNAPGSAQKVLNLHKQMIKAASKFRVFYHAKATKLFNCRDGAFYDKSVFTSCVRGQWMAADERSYNVELGKGPFVLAAGIFYRLSFDGYQCPNFIMEIPGNGLKNDKGLPFIFPNPDRNPQFNSVADVFKIIYCNWRDGQQRDTFLEQFNPLLGEGSSTIIEHGRAPPSMVTTILAHSEEKFILQKRLLGVTTWPIASSDKAAVARAPFFSKLTDREYVIINQENSYSFVEPKTVVDMQDAVRIALRKSDREPVSDVSAMVMKFIIGKLCHVYVLKDMSKDHMFRSENVIVLNHVKKEALIDRIDRMMTLIGTKSDKFKDEMARAIKYSKIFERSSRSSFAPTDSEEMRIKRVVLFLQQQVDDDDYVDFSSLEKTTASKEDDDDVLKFEEATRNIIRQAELREELKKESEERKQRQEIEHERSLLTREIVLSLKSVKEAKVLLLCCNIDFTAKDCTLGRLRELFYEYDSKLRPQQEEEKPKSKPFVPPSRETQSDHHRANPGITSHVIDFGPKLYEEIWNGKKVFVPEGAVMPSCFDEYFGQFNDAMRMVKKSSDLKQDISRHSITIAYSPDGQYKGFRNNEGQIMINLPAFGKYSIDCRVIEFAMTILHELSHESSHAHDLRFNQAMQMKMAKFALANMNGSVGKGAKRPAENQGSHSGKRQA
jgi:hypothetical protein